MIDGVRGVELNQPKGTLFNPELLIAVQLSLLLV
jgi:hypothetical protein